MIIWARNVTFRVLTIFYYSHIMKNALPPGGHVFQPTGTIFKLVHDIIEINVLTKFHEDRTINVASRVTTISQVIQLTGTIFELVQDIIKISVLTKFHEDRTINVTSRVITRKNASPPAAMVLTRKNAHGGHVFQPIGTIFKLAQDCIGTNLLTKCHEVRAINVNNDAIRRTTDKRRSQKLTMSTLCLGELKKDAAPGGHVFQATETIFELVQDIVGTNLASKEKKSPYPSQPCCSTDQNHFQLIQDIIRTNVLTKFHEEWDINATLRVLTMQPQDIIRTNVLTKFHAE
ncbi:hypothetical protein DPMN_110862 [Dreissena polymorpha]|uniref:Uncharacterized protein n=1 Tax=Dreissena polymorpha TaxID=45954 RepID=A0A9D4KCT3_DREPO|nr:hypothetical protein DPMN_110862 [Dreissena polymorpha]